MEVIGRILRRLALRLVRLGFRRRRVVFLGAVGISVLLVASAVGLGSRLGFSLPTGPADFGSREGEPSATARYLKGQEIYDAKMVWDSYSDRVLKEASQRGLSLDDTQRQLDR